MAMAIRGTGCMIHDMRCDSGYTISLGVQQVVMLEHMLPTAEP